MVKKAKKSISDEYRTKQKLYEGFCVAVGGIVKQLAFKNGMKAQIVSCRAKGSDSLKKKVEKKEEDGKVYGKLEEIEDLAGVRIVFYLESNREKFVNLFLKEFDGNILEVVNKDTAKGYRARHIIFTLNKKRESLPEYSSYKGLKCELQVTSSLYHVWSEIEHDIFYKPKLEDLETDADKEELEKLGLSELKEELEKVMGDHVKNAAVKFDSIHKKYEAMLKLSKLIGSDFTTEITKAKSNEDLFEILEVFEKFPHKKPDETIKAISMILNKKPLKEKRIGKFGRKIIYGKENQEILLKAVRLLGLVRYFRTNEVLEMVATQLRAGKPELRVELLKVIEDTTKFDYGYISRAKNYNPQKISLDFILAIPPEERIMNFELIERASRELLSSTFEGNEWTKDDTMSHHFGVIEPTDFIKDIRNQTISVLEDVYYRTNDDTLKLRVVKVMEQATYTPNTAYGDDVTTMIAETAGNLAAIYRKMIFKGKKIVGSFSVVHQIEQRIYWFEKTKIFSTPEISKLRKDILADKKYSLYRLFAGDPAIYYAETGLDAEEKRTSEIEKLIKGINKSNWEDFALIFDNIAKERTESNEWLFLPFKRFLSRLSHQTPNIAEKLFNVVIKNESPLKPFVGSILDGFRSSQNFTLWDKCVRKVVKKEDVQLVGSILSSLSYLDGIDLNIHIRNKDLGILQDITKAKFQFSFLKRENSFSHHNNVIRTLVRNFNRKAKLFEELMVYELTHNPDKKNVYINELYMGVVRKDIDLTLWSKKNISIIKELLINSNIIDFPHQALLLGAAGNNIDFVLDVFLKRIKSKINKKVSLDIETRYEAIPYHFNDTLKVFISSHPDYLKGVHNWLVDMTGEWSLYNWEVGHFVKRIGVGFEDIILSLIKAGSESNIKKAIGLMDALDVASLDLAIEVIRRTSNKDIIDRVRAQCYNVGIASGHYGLAEVYEQRAKDLEKYKTDKSPKVKNFVENMIKSFLENAKSDRIRVDDDKLQRKSDFETR